MQLRRASLLATGAVVGAIALGAPVVASAAGVQSGGGPLELGPPTVLIFQPIGPNFYTVQQGVLTLSGTVTGAGTITVTEIIHPAQGFSNLTATWDCPSCTVNGRPGHVVGSFVGKDEGEVTFGGQFTLAGVGTLAGFTAEGKFNGSDADGSGSYTIKYTG